MDLCLYRAGTDNDRGGGFFSYYSRWKELGLDSLSRKVERKAGAVRSYFVRATDGAVVVSLCVVMCTNRPTKSISLYHGNKGISCVDFGEQYGGAVDGFGCFEQEVFVVGDSV